MNRIIKNNHEHEAALARLEVLMLGNPPLHSAEADELELLALLIKSYEDKHVMIDPPTPLEAIRFRMEQEGLMQKDLVPYIGTKSRVSEVLAGKRPLTLQMARKLHSGLGIPAEILLSDTQETAWRWKQDIRMHRNAETTTSIMLSDGKCHLAANSLGILR